MKNQWHVYGLRLKARKFRALILTFIVGLTGTFNGVHATTSSQFKPPDEKLGVYMVDDGQGLDTGCTFRSGGPLKIKLRVPVVVNPKQLNSQGYLVNPSKLVANGVIGARVVLRFPVFDIDSSATGTGSQPEVDKISFNGKFKKNLSGVNNKWTDDSISVPIEEVRFGVDNEFRVDIDTANTSQVWCMAVDWVSAEFDVAAPYVLAHGISAGSDTWDGIVSTLDTTGVLYDRFSLGTGSGGNERSSTNAIELETNITNFLAKTKADKVHIIAHSKGGLDTQELQARAPEFKILTLSTLSTPHLGSVAGDLSIIQNTEADDKINSGNDPNEFVSDYLGTWTFGQGPQLPGLRDLTTYRATEAINLNLRGNIKPIFTIGANADTNGSNDLENPESDNLFPGAVHYAARRAWRVLRDFSSAPILSTTQVPGTFWGTKTVLTYASVVASTPQANDIVVTITSANPGYGTPLANTLNNHSTVKSIANINTLLKKTIPLR